MDDEEDSDDDGDDPVLGITSVINMTNHMQEKYIKLLEEHMVDKLELAPDKDQIDFKIFVEMFRNPSQNNQKNVGFLVNERYVNIPPAVSVPLFENLQKEVKRTGIEKKIKDFKFHYYVMILKLHRRAAKDDQPEEFFYSNPEEEFFAKNCQFEFKYSVAKECDTGLTGKWKENDEQLEPFRQVVVLDIRRVDNIINQGIKQFLIDGKVFDNILQDP
jgi:protein BCP1